MQLATPTTTLDRADLDALRVDLDAIEPDTFARDFYTALFDAAPAVRPLFSSDLARQRQKLMAELGTLVTMITDATDGQLDASVARLRRLGARHVGYGAQADHYAVVGDVLLTTLAAHLPTWDDGHLRRWTGVYTLVAATMQDGATHSATLSDV